MSRAKKPKGTGKAKATGKPGIIRYSPDLADAICERLSSGESLRAICRTKGMPPEVTVRLWAADPEHPFSAQYARARAVGAMALFDELLEIADDNAQDCRTVERDGQTVQVVDHEHIARARLRVDTRKWALSKMLPKVFGDRVTHQGDAENPVALATRIEMVIVDPADEGRSGPGHSPGGKPVGPT